MSFAPVLGAEGPMSETVCANKPPARQVEKSNNTKPRIRLVTVSFEALKRSTAIPPLEQKTCHSGGGEKEQSPLQQDPG